VTPRRDCDYLREAPPTRTSPRSHGYSADRSDTRIEAHQAKHISAERRAQLEENYLPHEREARIHGIPQLGIARVFPFPIETLVGTFNPDTDIKSWARWVVGIDFGYGHPFAAALCAWVNDTEEFYVVDGFRMERAEAFYHVKRLAGLCHGLRIPIAWPHDGLQHEKGSGQQLADIYKRLGAPMMATHAENHGGGFHTEPAIEEMCGYMKLGKIHNREPYERSHRGDPQLSPRRGLQDCAAARRSDLCRSIRLHDAPER